MYLLKNDLKEIGQIIVADVAAKNSYPKHQ